MCNEDYDQPTVLHIEYVYALRPCLSSVTRQGMLRQIDLSFLHASISWHVFTLPSLKYTSPGDTISLMVDDIAIFDI